MKSVLISIRPQWCEKIVDGKKTIEVRKTAPKEVSFKCYIYCTKTNNKWALSGYEGAYQNSKGEVVDAQQKVIGEFICDKVYKWNYDYCDGVDIDDDLIVDTCLDREDINIYAKGKTLYGWHISDLKIYDKPKELSEFRKPLDSVYCSYYRDYCEEGCVGFGSTDYVCNDYWNWEKGLTRPPQSWCYVEGKNGK